MMKKIFSLLVLVLLMLPGHTLAQKDLKLWYDQPAETWTEALPVGNGRIGGMVWGKAAEERIQLNEATFWSGGPVAQNVNPDAASHMPAIREAVFSGEYQKADSLAKLMQGVYSQSYMPLGELVIHHTLSDTTPSNYYRDLNISDATTTTRFTSGDVEYRREVFVSAPDQVMVVRMHASEPGALNATVSAISRLSQSTEKISENEWTLSGKAPAQVDPNYVNYNEQPIIYRDPDKCDGMRYNLRLKGHDTDGSISTTDNGIEIRNATEAVIVLSVATSFNSYDTCPDKNGRDETAIAKKHLQNVSYKTFDQLLREHLSDYHSYFNRVSISLGDETASSQRSLPTDERLESYADGVEDTALEALYFQFGRYLMISSSRTPGAPANLQGIWNPHMRPPWSSNYTININTEMNYWPAQVANLSEMHMPLLNLVENLSQTGQATAQNFYNADGWVAHHNTDIWALSNPVGDVGRGSPQWANWPMGGNWLSRQLWEYYLFTGDKAYLRNTAYPILKNAAEFSLDLLVEGPDGYLVTVPSTSPEIAFEYGEGKSANVSAAATMDMAIIRDLFTNLIKASRELGIDEGFREHLQKTREQLYPYKIGNRGNLQEWYRDWEATDIHHRHISHLYALHPGHSISPMTTPELADAARRTLEIRGDAGTGWSLAWKINFWARLLEGNHAHKLVRDLLQLTRSNDTDYSGEGGTYPNLFCAHPPFQIDGNFGGTAGIAEMLIQSHLDAIHLLPAIPDQWSEGEVQGLRARGGFEIDMAWTERELTTLEVKSLNGKVCEIRTSHPLQLEGTNQVSRETDHGYLISFETEQGQKYNLIPAE
ncbi:glycoside hydrolase N-terminal domain-containing protein [Aliifodinibius sp. S!AR15-10]|uniref:glycoside hydrolase family 95 protein n=1 Tax=Aliifodinibius sp. S!AR15-10 TaxID=2950437 RepID=UPI0028666377|nr:glycoside hydrolase N-terminal domain-containing protein [Aliifodinibius sp. S!AR15-10]MDR8393803.1 glycoside hydrolase N-terminal domain-containing protein [Aliifodinibius sp. S!AR15-10]